MATSIPYKQIEAIPGWFRRMDMELFRLLLDATEEHLGGGDLAELGAYLGKSAALMGCSLQPGETFTVIDLFSAEATTDDNQSENEEQYAELSQEAFEGYYRTVHDELPWSSGRRARRSWSTRRTAPTGSCTSTPPTSTSTWSPTSLPRARC